MRKLTLSTFALSTFALGSLLIALGGCEPLNVARPVVGGHPSEGGGGCTFCHGDGTRAGTALNPMLPAAPPRDTAGNTATTASGVGAHQAHLNGGAIRGAVACIECHTVPTDISHSTSHPPKLVWGSLATSGGATPAYSGGSCSSVYCHGGTLAAGGSDTTPNWTAGSSQAACGTCHGVPPPTSSGHPVVASDPRACNACHPQTVKPDGTIDVAGGKHINGSLEVTGGGGCTSCHGDSTRAATTLNPQLPAAPPRDTAGNTATTAAGVGAHQAHLNDGTLRLAIACGECHVVPTDSTHSTTHPPKLVWGTLAKTGGTSPSYSGGSCSSVYCHGATLSGGSDTTPTWTAGSSQAACGTCHGRPPNTGKHGNHSSRSCGDCHGASYSTTAVDTALHVNGVKDVGNLITSWNPITRQCVGCHGSATW